MFGLEEEGSSGKKNQPFIFDLEEDIKKTRAKKKYLETVQEKTQKLKILLRKGGSDDSYQQLGALLYGYMALVKILTRIK